MMNEIVVVRGTVAAKTITLRAGFCQGGGDTPIGADPVRRRQNIDEAW